MEKKFMYKVQLYTKDQDIKKSYPFSETLPMSFEEAVAMVSGPNELIVGVIVPVMTEEK